MIITLVLASAFLHALWNALLRIEKDRDRALVAAIAVATVIAAAVAAMRFALGDVAFAHGAAVAWALVAGAFEWLYFTSLTRALDRGPLGPIYTISRGGAVVIVWPASVVLFDERITMWALVGSAIVVGGLALGSARSGDPRTTKPGALAWASACAVAIAGYHLAYKAALGAGGGSSAVFAVALALATVINVVTLDRDDRRAIALLVRARTARVLAMGLVCCASFLLLIEALALDGGAGLVLTLRNTSVLFATGLAFAIGEPPRRTQIAGAVAVAAGAIAMSR